MRVDEPDCLLVCASTDSHVCAVPGRPCLHGVVRRGKNAWSHGSERVPLFALPGIVFPCALSQIQRRFGSAHELAPSQATAALPDGTVLSQGTQFIWDKNHSIFPVKV